MIAVRQIVKVENNSVTVHLPAEFAGQEVEVIVLPAAVNAATSEADAGEAAIQRILAWDTSKFSEAQLKAYKRTCALLRQGRKADEPRFFGLFAGLIEVADDFDSLPEEYIDLFYGDNLLPLEPEESETQQPEAQP
ncbi:MAG TPA: hypothetical protein PKE45_13435 [Caldilineaceae bacterium]|nr:hypothetical protein [Caldilineaceae bacterium]